MRHILLLLIAAAAWAQDMGRVEGRVVSSTGEPVRKATVRLETPVTRSASGQLQAQGKIEISGTDGSFVFDNVVPGRYILAAEKAGFGRLIPPVTQLTVAAGDALRHDLFLPALATISGRVVDQDGDPLSSIRVTASRYRWVGLERVAQRGATVQTDDRGEFRFANLEPGRYVVLAEDAGPGLRNGLLPGVELSAAARQVNLPTYFPLGAGGATGLSTDAKGGVDSPGIVIAMRRGETFTMRGTVVHGFSGEAMGGAVNVALRDAASQMRWNAGVISRDGFEVRGLPAGDYVARLTSAVAASGDPRPTGEAEFAITTTDANGIVLRAYPLLNIGGRVTVENGSDAALIEGLGLGPFGGGGATTPALPGQISGPTPVPSVNLLRPGSLARLDLGAGINADGTFELKGVPVGKYAVRVPLLPRSYVKAVRAGGSDLLRVPLDLTRGVPGQIEVVLATDGATLSPSAPAAVGEPKTRTLVMWPREPRLAETNAGIRTLTAGVAFSWTNVAPDEYYFALFEDVDVVTLQSYGYLAQFNELASRLTLTAGAAVEAEAKVIPRSAVEAAIP